MKGYTFSAPDDIFVLPAGDIFTFFIIIIIYGIHYFLFFYFYYLYTYFTLLNVY